MIRVVDYGVGNVQAFLNVFKRVGVAADRADTSEKLADSTHLVLPGVGHFDHAMQRLHDSGLLPRLEQLVMGDNVPLVGVCVGMQMLANGSDEGKLSGLNWIPGRVRAFAGNPNCIGLPMPHMGWNELQRNSAANLFLKGFDSAPQFYFLHSYYFETEDKSDVLATANYGIDFEAVISRGHIYGVQCHPEKSHHWGERLLKNFAEL